jgi:hypothetical protein
MNIEVSIGEILDKLTILEIKKDIIKNVNKLSEVEKELNLFNKFQELKNQNLLILNLLKWVNKQIWDFTNIIKDYTDLSEDFAILSKKIFNYNHYRFRIKNIINSKSNIKEQKSYQNDILDDSIYIKVNSITFYKNLTTINKLSILYDTIVICVDDFNVINLVRDIKNIYSSSNFVVEYISEKFESIGEDIDTIEINEFETNDIFEFPFSLEEIFFNF